MKVAIKLQNGYIVPNSEKDIEILKEFGNGIYEVDIKNMDSRTANQNKAYWLWASMISSTLNNSCIPIPKVIKLDTLWNKDKVSELIFKPTIKALFNKTSSTQLNKDEYDSIIDTITQAFGSKGIEIPPFPSYE